MEGRVLGGLFSTVSTVIVTGSAGLVGSESVRFYAEAGHRVVGIDNDMRAQFFGPSASTRWMGKQLSERYGTRYIHVDCDIRDRPAVEAVFNEHGADVVLIIHAAAQPSHDWAARDPETDFTVNANGTLVALEATRKFSPHAVFIFTSTNKVYGNSPNRLPLLELPTRWDLPVEDPHYAGISESMSIDSSLHSLFGASKAAADLLVQEYGRYFGIKTGVFRGGCLTGPAHSGAQLHGFLAYLMRCAIDGQKYTIFGYRGKQVRDNIHSTDLVRAFDEFFRAPRAGEVYNIGGSRFANCSMIEAIALCEEITEKKMLVEYVEENRIGDHIWYISDVTKFRSHYPQWRYEYGMQEILLDMFEGAHQRKAVEARDAS